jgi:glyoxylase-like metal-dependent hydrolase (beta-lactamase superfamily II)
MMERLFDNLYSVGTETLSFAPTFQGRAFLLRRSEGNLLLYSSGRIADEAEALLAQGGLVRQYLNHRHQAMASCDWVSERFAAPLFVPESERATIGETCRVGATFGRREHHFPDFEVIPIPGHTEGSTCFLWDDGQRRYLFTGDTIYLKDSEWVAAVLSVSDRAAYLESLKLMQGLEFDVLVPSMSRGEPIQTRNPADAREQIDKIIARLSSGEDS